MEKYKKAPGKMEIMLSRLSNNILFKNFFGLTSLVISIFIVFFILNFFYGPDKDSNSNENLVKEKKNLEVANEVIDSLPRGILATYESEKGHRLSKSEFKTICKNTKIITQRAVMGANITNSKAFKLYTENGGNTHKYIVNWDESVNKCFAKFTVKPLEGTTESVTVEGEALGFLKTSIDTRVYFIKNF